MDIKNKRYKIEVHQGWITDFKSLNIITTEYNLRLFEDDDIDIDIFYVTHKAYEYPAYIYDKDYSNYYKFSYSDIPNYFEKFEYLEEELGFEYNGISFREDIDNNLTEDEVMKFWEDLKSKFPNVSSKDDFNIEKEKKKEQDWIHPRDKIKENFVFGIKSDINLDRLIKAINQSSAIIEDNKEYLNEDIPIEMYEDGSRINIEKFIKLIKEKDGSVSLDDYVDIDFYENELSVRDDFSSIDEAFYVINSLLILENIFEEKYLKMVVYEWWYQDEKISLTEDKSEDKSNEMFDKYKLNGMFHQISIFTDTGEIIFSASIIPNKPYYPLDNIEFKLVDEEDQDLLENVYINGDLKCKNYFMRKKDFNKEKWWLGWS